MKNELVRVDEWFCFVIYLIGSCVRIFDPIPLRWPFVFCLRFACYFLFVELGCSFPTTTIPSTQSHRLLFLSLRERTETERHCCHIPAIPLFILFLPFEFSYIFFSARNKTGGVERREEVENAGRIN